MKKEVSTLKRLIVDSGMAEEYKKSILFRKNINDVPSSKTPHANEKAINNYRNKILSIIETCLSVSISPLGAVIIGLTIGQVKKQALESIDAGLAFASVAMYVLAVFSLLFNAGKEFFPERFKNACDVVNENMR